jgi:hypothetical protein
VSTLLSASLQLPFQRFFFWRCGTLHISRAQLSVPHMRSRMA